jgi:NDP-sugar pyrophosphorylase family protein
MARPVTKAMVLTAGLGTRLHPVTEKLPKPLVSVLNVPNILHVLFLLKKAGISQVVMNLFHLGERMESFFKTANVLDLKFSFTHENPILGTGGGVKNAERFLEGSHFVLANCDFVSDLNIKNQIDWHIQKKSKATMVLIQDESRQRLYSKVGINLDNHLVSLPKLQTQEATQFGIFTGIHVLDSEVLDYLEPKPCGINDTLYPKLMREFPTAVHGRIENDCFWYDTGDFPAFLQSCHLLLDSMIQGKAFIPQIFSALAMDYEEIFRGIWMPKGSSLPSSVKVTGPAVLGRNIQFGNLVSLGPYTIVGDNCLIEDNTVIAHSVILPESRVSGGSELSHVIQFGDLSLRAKTFV